MAEVDLEVAKSRLGINSGAETSKTKSLFLEAFTGTFLRALALFTLLYSFLVGVKSLEGSIKLMGSGAAEALLQLTLNPFASLLSGLLATSLIQSSSATTAIIVGLVSGGALSVGAAIPMVMGANIGTSITNTLVSLGYVRDTKNFKRAFSAATIHDFFNLLSVVVILPLELVTGILEKSATYLSSFLYGSVSGVHYHSPIKAALKPVVKGIEHFITGTLGLHTTVAGVFLAVVAAVIIMMSLLLIVKTMKGLIENNKANTVDKLLSKSPYVAMLVGVGFTVLVQSSSITTSLLIPFAGAGLLSLEAVMPVTLGANLGTTCTALLAALAGNVAGLAIALVHLLFNLMGILIWFPIPAMRRIPLSLAKGLGELVSRDKKWGFFYIAFVFIVIPAAAVFIFR